MGQRSDILAVTLSDYEVTLKPGESKSISVHIDRGSGFDKNVTLDVTYNHLNSVYGNSLPTGVSLENAKSKTLLTGSDSDGTITLTAAKDAVATTRQQFCVMAHVSLNFVMKATYVSQPIFITIEKPTE